jgi:hypothetical protein
MFTSLLNLLGRTWILTLVVLLGGAALGAFLGTTWRLDRGRLLYSLEPGQRWRHDLQFRASGSMDMGPITAGLNLALSGQPFQTVQTFVGGELTTDVLEVNGQEALLAYRMPKANVRLTVNGAPLVEAKATIEAELAEPVFARVNFQGQIQALYFSSQISDLSRNCLRGVLGATQVVLPTGDGLHDGWEVRELTLTGASLAMYQVDPDSPEGTIALVKSLGVSDEPRHMPGQASRTLHPDGDLRIVFDRGLGVVQAIKGTEVLTLAVDDKAISTTKVSIELGFLKKDSLAAPELERLLRSAREITKAAPAESLKALPSGATALAGQKRQLGDTTLKSLEADLADEEQRADPPKDQTPLYLKIKAMIAVHPESSARWGELVQKARPQSLTMKLVPSALAKVGHEQAQAALVTILKAQANDPALFQRMIGVLVMVENPSPLLENTLRALASDAASPASASMAQLALGTVARKLEESFPERAAAIAAWAIQQEQSATSETLHSHWLLVLGNTGARAALPAIGPRLGDKSESVRAAAVSALRFIDADQAEALLIHALSTDFVADVRHAAVAAFHYRSMTKNAFEANRKALRGDKAPAVRLAAMNLLWQVRQRYAEVDLLVEAAAASDVDADIRQAARRLLSSVEKGE